MKSKSCLQAINAAHIGEVVQLHFNEKDGSPYWLRQSPQYLRDVSEPSFKAFRDRFAFANRASQKEYEEALRRLPIEEFVPKITLRDASWIWASETGGTTGIAKRGTWDSDYWHRILTFSDEFLDLHGVPRNENWLFVGPTGPHTTGRLMISIAEHRRGRIFCIDMDPRIVRVYIKDNDANAVERYIRHIWEQVDPIIRYQNVGVMFCTASLLELMLHHIDLKLLQKLKAVVHAGLAMSRDTHRYLRQEIFPAKPVVGLYGTSVSGISYQKPYEPEDEFRVIYIPSQPYVVLETIDSSGNLVGYGEVGDVRCYRFTRDQIIPGFVERDLGTRIKPFGDYADRYPWDWLGDPHSPAAFSGQQMEGVY